MCFCCGQPDIWTIESSEWARCYLTRSPLRFQCLLLTVFKSPVYHLTSGHNIYFFVRNPDIPELGGVGYAQRKVERAIREGLGAGTDQISPQTASVSGGKGHQEPETRARPGISQLVLGNLFWYQWETALEVTQLENFNASWGSARGTVRRSGLALLTRCQTPAGSGGKATFGFRQFQTNPQVPRLHGALYCLLCCILSCYYEGPKMPRL